MTLRHLYGLIIFSLPVLIAVSCSGGSDNQPEYISSLDDMIERSDEFRVEKEMKIEELKRKLARVSTPAEQFSLNSLIFDEYYTFNSDSASRYIDSALALAKQEDNPDWVTRCLLKKAAILSVTGMLASAQDLLTSLPRDRIPDELLVDYYADMVYLNSHLGNYAGGNYNDFYARERQYKDSLIEVIEPSHPEYLWFKGLDILGTDKDASQAIDELKANLESSSLNTPQDAKNAYILARLYEQEKDMDNYRKYMALSASVDVRIANYSEISSMEELSRAMFNDGKGDIDRAYKYMSYCLEKAISYPNRVKAVGLSGVMENINKAYRERNETQKRRTTGFLIAICILAAVLIAAIGVIVRQIIILKKQSVRLHENNETLNRNIRELNSTHDEIHSANRRLKELIADLEVKNEELNEANYVKEEYIGSIFSICSDYIDKLAELKKSIHLKVLHKKYAEIENETEDFDMRSELKDFYRAFDTIFLHIYPDFVNDFNALLQEDKRIVPKEGELLNTELRIYALIRLGITDSVKIADFLHCSPQTIYNNRFKVRSKAIIPKEKFLETVRTLGTYVNKGL